MYTEFKPGHLNNLISAIWYADSDVDPAEGHVVTPGFGSELVIKLYPTEIETVLSGPTTQQNQYPFVADAHYFGVRFAPSVGPVFDNILLRELKNNAVEVDRLLGIDLESLAYQLHGLQAWPDQKELIEAAICQKYPENVDFANPNVLFAISVANKFCGNIPVEELAATVGVSRRHLERLFLRYIGLSPKTFCTTLRMQRVLDILQNRQPASLAMLALDCGYTDQAHLANEFKHVMGTSILAYLDSKIE